ncbi:MAG: diaminopimelate dehydrogenase [Acholeplasmatales bacterium]|nr:diaminopimelate dehydrogenase [Acholeplasmatales bacterium]
MIKIGIFGYGNLARGVEAAIKKNDDMELVAVFSRRDPKDVKINTEGVNVYRSENVTDFKDKIDVLIICGGSRSDLPVQTPKLVKDFNVIDSFDTHAHVLDHFNNVNKVAVENNHIAVISTGWDPGMFSLNRAIMEAILPDGESYTFWGKGVSQGHSDAIRRIKGVIDARQYTVPVEEALKKVRSGENPKLTTREKHTRLCYVVADEKDHARIEKEIKEMPDYFVDYDTTVNFISLDEMKKNHSKLPHGGFVIRSGESSNGTKHVVEYSLKLDSNPEFTGSVLVAYARAAYRAKTRREAGCRTVFDFAPKDLSRLSYEDLIKHTL